MDTWILLRGLTREASHWGAFAGDFQTALPQAKVVALDLPGNGQLHALPSPLTVQGMVAACRAELARQGVLPPFHLFAMSLGAMVATEWARTAPEEIRGCVLVNTSLRPFSPFFHRLRPRNYAALLRLALRPRSAEAIERTVWRLTSNAPDPRNAVIGAWVDYVGIVRTNKRLQRAQHRVRLLLDEIDEFYSNYKVSRDLIELRNLAQVAELIIRSAMLRHESRGLHYTLDYPEQLAEARDTILVPAIYAD